MVSSYFWKKLSTGKKVAIKISLAYQSPRIITKHQLIPRLSCKH